MPKSTNYTILLYIITVICTAHVFKHKIAWYIAKNYYDSPFFLILQPDGLKVFLCITPLATMKLIFKRLFNLRMSFFTLKICGLLLKIAPIWKFASMFSEMWAPGQWCSVGLQRFVDVIDYVDYKNMSISMECVDCVAPLATPIVRAWSYPYLRLFFLPCLTQTRL